MSDTGSVVWVIISTDFIPCLDLITIISFLFPILLFPEKSFPSFLGGKSMLGGEKNWIEWIVYEIIVWVYF